MCARLRPSTTAPARICTRAASSRRARSARARPAGSRATTAHIGSRCRARRNPGSRTSTGRCTRCTSAAIPRSPDCSSAARSSGRAGSCPRGSRAGRAVRRARSRSTRRRFRSQRADRSRTRSRPARTSPARSISSRRRSAARARGSCSTGSRCRWCRTRGLRSCSVRRIKVGTTRTSGSCRARGSRRRRSRCRRVSPRHSRASSCGTPRSCSTCSSARSCGRARPPKWCSRREWSRRTSSGNRAGEAAGEHRHPLPRARHDRAAPAAGNRRDRARRPRARAVTIHDPYQPPTSPVDGVAPEFERVEPVRNAASRQRRLLGYVVDNVACRMLDFAIVVAIVIVRIAFVGGSADGSDNAWTGFVVLFGPLLSPLPYYILLEGCFGRTLGKVVTGTRVVRADGGPPTFRQVVRRSLVRLIPFETFTILGKKQECVHDLLSGTLVVPAHELDPR
ncbi:MAG: RDD family protein [Planctomycetota bacterium]|nr:MAG: RDD family protein [Planctomycetota bacterium]